MACLPLPELPMPTLPGGLSLDPPELPPPPGGNFSLLCCKLLQFEIPAPPISLPPLTISSATAAAVATAIKNAMTAMQNFIDNIPLECPKE